MDNYIIIYIHVFLTVMTNNYNSGYITQLNLTILGFPRVFVVIRETAGVNLCSFLVARVAGHCH